MKQNKEGRVYKIIFYMSCISSSTSYAHSEYFCSMNFMRNVFDAKPTDKKKVFVDNDAFH